VFVTSVEVRTSRVTFPNPPPPLPPLFRSRSLWVKSSLRYSSPHMVLLCTKATAGPFMTILYGPCFSLRCPCPRPQHTFPGLLAGRFCPISQPCPRPVFLGVFFFFFQGASILFVFGASRFWFVFCRCRRWTLQRILLTTNFSPLLCVFLGLMAVVEWISTDFFFSLRLPVQHDQGVNVSFLFPYAPLHPNFGPLPRLFSPQNSLPPHCVFSFSPVGSFKLFLNPFWPAAWFFWVACSVGQTASPPLDFLHTTACTDSPSQCLPQLGWTFFFSLFVSSLPLISG